MADLLKKLCCFTTQWCKCSCLGFTRNQNIKLVYNLLIFLAFGATLLAITLKVDYTGQEQEFNCFRSVVSDIESCVNREIIYRVSLSLSLMFLILGLCMCLRSETAKIINQGTWLIKILFVTIFSTLLIEVFFSSISQMFQRISVYGLVIYYFLQSVVVIDGVYAIDGFFNRLSEDGAVKRFLVIKAIFCVISVVVAIGINVLSYYFAALQLSICNSVLMGILFLVVLFRMVKGFNLLIWGCFWAYANILTLLIHNGIYEKGDNFVENTEEWVQIIISFMFLAGIVSQGSNKLRTSKSSLNEILALNTNKEQQDTRYVASNKWIIYHVIMSLIILTLPIALDLNGQTSVTEQLSQTISIQRFTGLILTYLLFLWSLICSKIYPERDFSIILLTQVNSKTTLNNLN